MAGTKMRLQRYGNEVSYRYEQEIIVDQNFLDSNNGLFITLTNPYMMGSNMLDIYFNGQRLSEGGGYEEMDPYTIRLDLGTYPPKHPLAGQTVPLSIGDEIYITTWKAEYLQTSGNVDVLRFLALEDEVVQARKYKPTDIPFSKLDDRLDYIQDRATMRTVVLVLTKIKTGAAGYSIPLPISGKVSHVVGRLGSSGTEDTIVRVEKCAAANADSPVWVNILSTNVVVEADKLYSKSSAQQPVISAQEVDEDDSLRLYIEQVGEGAEGLVVEVSIYT